MACASGHKLVVPRIMSSEGLKGQGERSASARLPRGDPGGKSLQVKPRCRELCLEDEGAAEIHLLPRTPGSTPKSPQCPPSSGEAGGGGGGNPLEALTTSSLFPGGAASIRITWVRTLNPNHMIQGPQNCVPLEKEFGQEAECSEANRCSFREKTGVGRHGHRQAGEAGVW